MGLEKLAKEFAKKQSMKDTNGTAVIAEAIKYKGYKLKSEQLIKDLLCTLCDNDATVGEALYALKGAQIAIKKTKVHVAKYGNNLDAEDSYGENGE